MADFDQLEADLYKVFGKHEIAHLVSPVMETLDDLVDWDEDDWNEEEDEYEEAWVDEDIHRDMKKDDA